ncbi:hypothetical protein [Caballeronia humi]|uniref:Uncharacterized protein n=1 Tax=Caballeronia humi TaxID=326474 RepID=A0A158IXE4_9BURK|nr:hypothetical protein [Caballeronia humi]SAL61155.1 hypothetical protein AWB65_05560 [Caballeronia humi]
MTTASSDEPATPDEDLAASPTEISVPIGDAIPTPVEPGLDQPLPEKADADPGPDSTFEPPAEPPIDVSKPIGDAIPTTHAEPGTDQPLPEKNPDA